MKTSDIPNSQRDFLDSILKISSCVDGLLNSINDYYRSYEYSAEESADKLKKAQISFLKSLVVNDGAKQSSKSRGFLYSTYFPYTNKTLIEPELDHHNSNKYITNFNNTVDFISPLILDKDSLMNIEFSSDVLNNNTSSELWAKIIQWSNRSTKILDAYMGASFGEDKIDKYNKYYRNIMSNLSIVDESKSTRPASRILAENDLEDNFYNSNPDASLALGKVPRLTMERYLEVLEYSKEVGLDEALEEYSEYFKDKNDFLKVENSIIEATKYKNKKISNNEVLDFTKYLVYKSRIRRLYQIKSVALSEFCISNVKDNSAKVYTKYDYSKAGLSRDKTFGIMLKGYTEPIEIHINDYELEECKDRTLKITGKKLSVPETNFQRDIKTGMPFKITEKQFKSIDSQFVSDKLFRAQKFLVDSYNDNIKIEENEKKEIS